MTGVSVAIPGALACTNHLLEITAALTVGEDEFRQADALARSGKTEEAARAFERAIAADGLRRAHAAMDATRIARTARESELTASLEEAILATREHFDRTLSGAPS